MQPSGVWLEPNLVSRLQKFFKAVNKVEFFNTSISQKSLENVVKVLSSTFVSAGKVANEFEKELTETLGLVNPVSVNSGTSALHLALHSLKKPYNIKDGDEVLCTPLTCTATNWPVLANNLKIKWVDINPNNLHSLEK